MKKVLFILSFIFVSFISFAQRQRTTATFDADTTTRPKSGFYGVGIRAGKVYIVPYSGTNIRLANYSLFTGLTTNYVTKWNGSKLVNGLAFDNGSNFSIGTNTDVDSYSRLYVFGGDNGANIDARGSNTGYDQAIIDLQGKDYATTFHSVHLRYQGIGAFGTTFGYSNKDLADLTYNYTGNDRAFIIRTLYNNPIIFGIDNVVKSKISNTGINITDGDLEIDTINKGVIIKSPNGTRWRITVNNSGTLITTSL